MSIRGGTRRAASAGVLAAALAAWLSPARAQDQVVNFRKPILVVETGGHSAPVRSLVWSGTAGLLSGGLDKVVRDWDLAEGGRLARTLRPMIWRGTAGAIFAMDLSRPDAQGQSLLAVAGYGVESRRGDITVFRYPGAANSGTGEVAARMLPPAPPGRPNGHTDSVLCLAFDPAGKVLATGGGNLDRKVILWDTTRTVADGQNRAFPALRILEGHTRAIRRLAFLPPEGRRLATASEDGTLRVWDVATGAELARSPANAQNPVILNALAVSPDGRTLVVGRENGDIYAFDSSDVARIPPTQLPTQPNQGSIEALAFHPDGKRLAVSLMGEKPVTIDPMTIACDLEVRAMPGGALIHRRRVPGLVYALAFSPDAGGRLAYSGGMDQSVYVQDMDNLARPPSTLKGQGSTPFDLGFGPDDRVLGFTREFDPTRPPALYEGFEPATRRAATIPRADLRRAITTLDGWTLKGDLRTFTLEAAHQDGRRWRADLDPSVERNWWSSTMIPPGPGHPRPTVAVGCETGVLIFDLETGRRTRSFAGHRAAVVSVVPSRDGHWLASAGLDQVILFYPLAGCDTRPGFGAEFRREGQGAWTVARVAPRGFAAGMGLKVGDTLVDAVTLRRSAGPDGRLVRSTQWFRTPEEIEEFVRGIPDEVEPYDVINMRVRRGAAPGAIENLGTTKRDNPALALLQDSRREWVFWTPQGYYDTSIEGDTRLLGWHINASIDQTKSNDFVPVGTYPALYRPNVIERLWTTRDLDAALAALPAGAPQPEDVAEADQPPKIALAPVGPGLRAPATGVWESGQPRPRLKLSILAEGPAALGAREVVLDERVVLASRPIGPGRSHEEEFEIDLPPGRRVRLLVKATNQRDANRTATIDLEYKAPPPPERPKRRLVVLGLGVESFPDGKLPDIPFAGRDAKGIAGFLAQHLVAVDGTRPVPAGESSDANLLIGTSATAAEFRGSLDRLSGLIQEQELNKGDVVALVIASHVLAFRPGELPGLAASDARAGEPNSLVPAGDLSEQLGRVADYGCRVVVFLDGVHAGELPGGLKSDVKAWVRDLQQRRRVVTFVAAKEGPNGVSRREEQGLFALGVLNAFRTARASGSPLNRDSAYTVEQFRLAVEREVLDRSERQQESDCFLPQGVPPWTSFVRP